MVTLIKNQRVGKRSSASPSSLPVMLSPPVSEKTRGLTGGGRTPARPSLLARGMAVRWSLEQANKTSGRRRNSRRAERRSEAGGQAGGATGALLATGGEGIMQSVSGLVGRLSLLDRTFLVSGILFVIVSLYFGSLGVPGSLVARIHDPISLPSLSLADRLMEDRLARGDSPGAVAPVADIDPTRFKSLEFQYHTLSSGETLEGLSRRYGISMWTIAGFNPTRLQDVRRMQIGDVYRIPNREGLPHVVQPGESLSLLAGRYGVTVNAILDANDLRSEVIQVGQELFIPNATMDDVSKQRILGTLFVYPVSGRFTSGFGYRADPFTGRRTFHYGLDLANDLGTPIGAARSGRVSHTGWTNLYGNFVIIQHDGEYESLYAHLSTIDVSRGAYVSQGGRIGTMGSTGYSTGSHLHFSIIRNGRPVDPLEYLH